MICQENGVVLIGNFENEKDDLLAYLSFTDLKIFYSISVVDFSWINARSIAQSGHLLIYQSG
jgi:hypothetical protein